MKPQTKFSLILVCLFVALFSLHGHDFSPKHYILFTCYRYTVYDISHQNKFLVSLAVEVCWTSGDNCDGHFTILDNHPFSKQICSFTSGFLIDGNIYYILTFLLFASLKVL